MRTAHSLPMAGHLGQKKTAQRITRRFFWPGIYSDVQKLCKSCTECQKTARHTRCKAPLMPLPVIATPFERIAMDIVGPLPRTKAGHRFILTVMDYASRYPEAIPLKKTDSQTIADALMTVFSRMGFPKEILSDNGSNLTGKVMTQLFNTLKSNN